MCFFQRSSTPTAAPVAPAPTRDSMAAGTDPLSLAAKARSVLSRRQGIFGNIATTPMGDASYGSSSFATFGARG